MAQVTLEQWQCLLAVVDQGGYAAAAETLQKSQSSVSYAIQQLESRLNIRVFRLEGRRSVLTPAGQTLYRRARLLVDEARMVESLADQLAQGWEPALTLAMDTLFPVGVMLKAINRFSQQQPLTRITLQETVLSGTDEALLEQRADLVIGGRIAPGFFGDPIMDVNFIAVATPSHPLHQLNRTLQYQDLRLHRQVVVQDSGKRNLDAGWLGAEQRLTVSHIHTSIRCVQEGLGYAWLPELQIQTAIQQDILRPLPLESGGRRKVPLYLIYSAGDNAGPAARCLGNIILDTLQATMPA
ncbi:LysR family transcriptional regulator [Pontibacter sp. JAM-7]|uniref:LysR family transcriptional regulator n=1 Tax=Pontibacter sp. JAM-7 TaxID=3366581 RepID=UPI003AF48317